tara:strand:- start:63 stop:266 length:204 start_codon:yes stop_codon:yes gene_type:complete
MSDSFTKKPINIVEEDLRSINRMINTMLIDTQSIKSDIAEIKLLIKEREKREEYNKAMVERRAWWLF